MAYIPELWPGKFFAVDSNMQQLVKDFVSKYKLNTSCEIRYLDLISEIGELGKEIIKCQDYGKKEFVMTPQVTEELGDCLFSLFALCEELGVDGEKALMIALEKYRLRFDKKGSVGSEI